MKDSGRLTLGADALASLEARVADDPILSNAFRLMRDASLLFDHGRFASTVALASLALEEIGKYTLRTWSAQDPRFTFDKRRLHVMKQSAVAALFMMERIRRTYRERNFDFSKLRSAEGVAELAALIIESLEKERDSASAVVNQILEVVKWSGMYYDDDLAKKGVEPSRMTAEYARSIMETVSRAFIAIADEGTLKLAAYAFPYLYPPAMKPRHSNN